MKKIFNYSSLQSFNFTNKPTKTDKASDKPVSSKIKSQNNLNTPRQKKYISVRVPATISIIFSIYLLLILQYQMVSPQGFLTNLNRVFINFLHLLHYSLFSYQCWKSIFRHFSQQIYTVSNLAALGIKQALQARLETQSPLILDSRETQTKVVSTNII